MATIRRSSFTLLRLISHWKRRSHECDNGTRHMLYGRQEAMMQSSNRFLQMAVIVGTGLCFALPAASQGVSPPGTSEIEALAEDAKKGDKVAQRKLGSLYFDGRGVPQDPQIAAGLFQEAADNGDAAAKNNLGLMYLDGQGVEKDPQMAVELFPPGRFPERYEGAVQLGPQLRDRTGCPRRATKWRRNGTSGLRSAVDRRRRTILASCTFSGREWSKISLLHTCGSTSRPPRDMLVPAKRATLLPSA